MNLSVWNLSILFLIPFFVFVIIPKLGPLYRKVQMYLHKH